MMPAIEQIVHADETARELVTAARTEADMIRQQAERRAQEVAASRSRELAETVRAEQESVLADARSRASQIAADTERYIAELQHKQQAIQNDLIEALLNKVIGL